MWILSMSRLIRRGDVRQDDERAMEGETRSFGPRNSREAKGHPAKKRPSGLGLVGDALQRSVV